MIKLNEHIVEIEGKQYVPAEIAVQAVSEALIANEDLKNAFKDMNNTINDALKDD